MINPDKTLTERALAGARFLRMHAEVMADDDNFFVALMSEPHTIAARAIEQLVKENEELRAQLVAFQKAANPAVAVDPTAHPHTAYWRFTTGTPVRLKTNPDHRGKVTATRGGSHLIQSCYVQFKTPFEHGYWVDVQHLELIPDK
ncbi:hypothetical protein ACQR7C_06955 [Salmonella enterica]|uniref:hypothetical protein n=1 Tax=Salmonella enterica TaxID=28901 RepID=UPI003D2ECAD2